MFISGGAPLPGHIGKWFNLIGLTLLEGYGMTECSPVLAVNRPDNISIGSVGPPLPDIKIKINKPNEEGIGEIIVRGGNTTPGYLNNHEATSELLRDGWLYTGDMGKMDKGLLYITGRSKNIIISGGGKNIFPEEIEGYLNQSDYILESLAVGRERAGKTGEEIWAIIVPDKEQIELELTDSGVTLSENRIRELIGEVVKNVNGRLADYKRIVDFEIRTEEFEKTAAKKIKRIKYR
jgi:long-chain acyl-CoA synthetase